MAVAETQKLPMVVRMSVNSQNTFTFALRQGIMSSCNEATFSICPVLLSSRLGGADCGPTGNRNSKTYNTFRVSKNVAWIHNFKKFLAHYSWKYYPPKYKCMHIFHSSCEQKLWISFQIDSSYRRWISRHFCRHGVVFRQKKMKKISRKVGLGNRNIFAYYGTPEHKVSCTAALKNRKSHY